MGVGFCLVRKVVGGVGGGIHFDHADGRHLHVGVGLEAEGEDGDADEEYGDDTYHLKKKKQSIRGLPKQLSSVA